MGDGLPCPMPAGYKHKHSHLMLAIRHGKDVAWIEEETAKLRKWAESKGVLRLSWDRSLSKWLEKAILFEQQQEAGRRAYGTVGNGTGGSSVDPGRSVGELGGHNVADLAAKTATYHKFLESNERMAAEYLERQPERVRRAILGSGN
jgi:hypothetical protein